MAAIDKIYLNSYKEYKEFQKWLLEQPKLKDKYGKEVSIYSYFFTWWDDPDDIPDLNPHSDEEAVGCLAGVCGFIVSSIVYVLLFSLCFTFTKGMLRPILIFIDSAVVYPIVTIYLMELSFKIGDKIYKKIRK